MKIKVGDRVKFLNDTGAGEVVRIMDQKTALVQIDGGFEVPWLINDLVVVGGSSDPNEVEEVETQVQSEVEKKSFSETIDTSLQQSSVADEELVLAFLPDENSSGFETYLINSSSYLVKYTISRKSEGEMVLFHEDTLEPGIKIHLGNYRPGNLNDEELFRIQGIFYNSGFFHHLPPLDILLKVSASEMYDAGFRKETEYFHEKVVLFSLYDWRKPKKEPRIDIDTELLKKAMMTKGDIKPEKKKVVTPGLQEIDLHIEHLVDRHKHMENAEMIEIQLAKFRTSLETAILHKTKKIVFIHGVGNGKLKHEIRKILDTEYRSSVRYQDASFKEYGYGATMVMGK